MNQDTSLLLTRIFPPKVGGSGRWLWEIYRRMPRDRFLIAAGEDPRQAEFDRTHDLAITRVPLEMADWGIKNFRSMRAYLRAWRVVRRLVRQHGIARLHCGTLLNEGWIARMIKATERVPYWSFVHGEDLNLGLLSRELGWMLRRVLRGAERLVANSRNTQSLLCERWGVPAEKTRLLTPGVDVDRFCPAAADAAVRARLGWCARPVVLTVGRLTKRKGHDQMIRALTAIRQAVPDVLYAVVGGGEERSSLETLAGECGVSDHVRFCGELDDAAMIECYQQCDLFALPNREVQGDIEGFGMVLLEAQACGKPVIAGASGGTAETMQTPTTGRLVSCDGPEELARTVVELLGDPALRRRMGAAARQWAVERFSWDALSRQAAAIFDEGHPR